MNGKPKWPHYGIDIAAKKGTMIKSSGSGECRLEGLCIKASPLGENDRLITILNDEQGIVRLAVPGARRPKSSLAAATPLHI